ncbi:MAG: hypothetical protein N7Q72_01655 [Spiroplasma sp. Tabriz.8]|nr:hypothetical protein [Spiroplasma sp. Tabriz.8]
MFKKKIISIQFCINSNRIAYESHIYLYFSIYIYIYIYIIN